MLRRLVPLLAATGLAAAEPAVPAYRLPVGTVFWWDTRLDWTFTPAGSEPSPIKEVPTRLIDYAIWRGEVVRIDDSHPVIAMRPLYSWALGEQLETTPKVSATLHLPDGDRTVNEAHLASSGPLSSSQRMELLIAPGELRCLSVTHAGEWSLLLSALGLYDLLLPLPKDELALGVARTVPQGSVTRTADGRLAYDFPMVSMPKRQVMTSSLQALGVMLQVAVFAEAKGSATSAVEWGDGLPASSHDEEKLEVTITAAPVDGPADAKGPRLSGGLRTVRDAALLHPAFSGKEPASVQELMSAVAKERQAVWTKRFDEATDPIARDLAWSVLNTFVTPPEADTAALGWPGGEDQTPAGSKNF